MDPATIAALALSALTLVLVLVLVLRKAPPDPYARDLQERLARVDAKLDQLGQVLRSDVAALRTELTSLLNQAGMGQRAQLTQMGEAQMNQLKAVMASTNEQLANLSKTVDLQLKDMRESVALRLQTIQQDNAQQLEKMRATVDEKLQKTLEERLGQSFRLVSERLEQVQKGLGEMQTLAVGVGDLKKVLTNVKTRGTMGEYQLGALLEQLLAPDQYEANVRTKAGSLEVVEYAIKLPGKDADGSSVYLPVDSKFPIEDYAALQAAYDAGDAAEIDAKGKAVELAFRKAAKDIHDKYLDPPGTTDFGILFVPVEGLYAEVLRRPALLERLQGDFKVNVAGPATFAALLSSLRMGFQTLAVEKRSSEVWKLLSAVKTEFGKFGDALAAAQKKIKQADEEIETLVGTRTRVLQRKLKDVGTLPAAEAKAALESSNGSDAVPSFEEIEAEETPEA